MMSVFQPKKKEPLMSVAPRMSVAPKQNTQSAWASSNPLSQLGKSMVQGNGTKAIQSTFRATPTTTSVFQSKAPVATPKPVQPQQSRVIQGSGMGTSYASNPTNYKAPQPAPALQPQPQPTQSPNDAYLKGMETLASQQQNFATRQQANREASTKSKYQTLKEMISGQLPVAEQNFSNFKTDSEADIADLRATGERQKGQAEDYYGEAQRDAAKTFRDTQGDNQRTFANLGTVDSRGEGSFQQAAENTTSDFNRFTQQTLRAKADRFAEIDTTVSGAERKANALIRQEAVKLEDLKKQIQFALVNNDQAMADELTGIANETEQFIMSVQEAVTGLKYQADMEKYKLELQGSEKPSAQFLQTGVPQTEADYTWKLNNAKEYGEAFPNMAGNSESRQKMSEALDTSDLIDRVLRSNTDPLTGTMRLQGGWNPEAKLKAQETASLIEQVSNQLQLAAAGKLKGQGQITENERAILRSAVLALNPDGKGGYAIGDGELRKRLTEAQNILLRDSGLQGLIPQVDNATLVKQFGG